MPQLQCVSVTAWPESSCKANLPNVLEGSVTVVCMGCKRPVWMSPMAAVVARKDRNILPVCEVCKPAKTVEVTLDPPPTAK